jgi:pimeloyl-ACP methyl ester carboxylesterase
VHGEGPPLLLLHGGLGSIPEKWIPDFSPRFQVIAMEQMGHGRTADAVHRPFHYHDMAEDTVELMRQLGIESASVLSYSHGGIIGLEMAIDHPAHVTKLAVTGANCRTDGSHGRPRRARRKRRIPLDTRRNEHRPGWDRAPVKADRVRISGFEEWTIGDDGLIAASLGHYDQAEYDRQLEHGVELR